jgi:hypothetical protein
MNPPQPNASWIATEQQKPPAGEFVLGFWTPPRSGQKHIWVIVRWHDNPLTSPWQIIWRADGGLPLAVSEREIRWWSELLAPPEGIEIES